MARRRRIDAPRLLHQAADSILVVLCRNLNPAGRRTVQPFLEDPAELGVEIPGIATLRPARSDSDAGSPPPVRAMTMTNRSRERTT